MICFEVFFYYEPVEVLRGERVEVLRGERRDRVEVPSSDFFPVSCKPSNLLLSSSSSPSCSPLPLSFHSLSLLPTSSYRGQHQPRDVYSRRGLGESSRARGGRQRPVDAPPRPGDVQVGPLAKDVERDGREGEEADRHILERCCEGLGDVRPRRSCLCTGKESKEKKKAKLLGEEMERRR